MYYKTGILCLNCKGLFSYMMKTVWADCGWNWFRGSAMLMLTSLILFKFPSLAKGVSCSPTIMSAGMRRKQPFPAVLCHVEEDLGQRLEVGSFNQQRLPHPTFLLTHLCSTIFKEERFCSLVFQTKKCWKGRVWM